MTRNLGGYPGALWVNANLKMTDKGYIRQRQLRYYLAVPSFFGSTMQAAINLDPETTNARTLHRQLRQTGITHFLLPRLQDAMAGYEAPLNILDQRVCLVLLKRFKFQSLYSRTLSTLFPVRKFLDVLKLKDKNCLL